MRWRRLGGEMVHDARIFRLRRDQYEFQGRPVHPFYVIETPTWVNVVPVTPDNEVVLVRQYRHGIQEDSLEIPGGMVDAEDADPAAAAARELLEETGYAGVLEPLGAVTSNPAILTNRTHFFVARDAQLVAAPSPDENEDITVELAPVSAIAAMIRAGVLHHSLCVCALTLFLLGRDT